MYLLDTNVISELRKAAKADPRVTAWATSVPAADLYLSVLSVLELEVGMLLLARRDAAQGAMLRAWFEQRVLPAFAGRILPIDLAIARRCAPLHVPDHCSDRDALIAATALVHGLTVVTRNISDFQSTGVRILNPWEG
jgi:toxin FitB